MATTTAKTSIATTIWIALGSSTGAVCFAALLVVMIILALIPIYIPDQSQPGFGEEYFINALMLKSLYGRPPASSTSPNFFFYNSTMADNTQLSTLCANTYRNQLGQQNVAACIIDNIKAWASNDNTTTQRRRRRALDIGGLYTISQARIFYSTACASQSDRGKNATSPYLSRCASQRLAACNKLYNNPASLTPWAIPPTSMAYSVVDTYFTSFVIIAVYQVFGVSPTHALSVANNNNNNFGLTANITNLLNAGCQYIGPLSHAAIANIIAAQASETTTLPSSTWPSG